MRSFILTVLLAIAGPVVAQEIKTYGLRINATDLDQAVDFYSSKLGFEIESRTNENVFLKSGDATLLVIHKVTHLLPEANTETRAGISLQVNDLDKTIASLRSKGLDFGAEQKRKEGVGFAIFVNDPFGKQVSLLQQTIGKNEPFKEPRIYNYGFRIPDMDKAIDFYTKLMGFVPLTERYLPLDMPLGHADKSFGFMLHYRDGIEPIHHNSTDTEHLVVLFKTNDLEAAVAQLRKKGVQFLQKKPVDSSLGKSISFYDPFGYLSEIIQEAK